MKLTKKFWIYYFYIYSTVLLLGTFSAIGKSSGGPSDLSSIFSILISLTGWLGLYGFVYSKRFFIKNFWILFFIIEIIGFAIGILYPMLYLVYETLATSLEQTLFALLILCFVCGVSIPILLAHYKYIFTKQWNANYA